MSAEPKLYVISLGAGVQSTTMALMAAHGEIRPMPNCAIFADTGWEPKAVYDHLRWLMSGNVLPFPVHIVRRPGLDLGEHAQALASGSITCKGSAPPPFFTRNPDGMLSKRCSGEFKRDVITREARRLLGDQYSHGEAGQVEFWLGISTDEMER